MHVFKHSKVTLIYTCLSAPVYKFVASNLRDLISEAFMSRPCVGCLMVPVLIVHIVKSDCFAMITWTLYWRLLNPCLEAQLCLVCGERAGVGQRSHMGLCKLLFTL